MRTIFNHHMTTTVITDHIGLFIMDVYFLQLFLGSIHIMFQIRIEVPDYCLPLYSTILHTVQKSLHGSREIHVHNAWERLLHNTVYHLAQLCHIKVTLLLGNIAAADNGGDGRRISTRTADSKLLHGLYQGSLCIMCRRLGKMLFRL